MKTVDRVLPFFFGLLAFMLRLYECKNGFDEQGLPVPSFPVLPLILALTAILFFLLSFRFPKRETVVGGFSKLFDFNRTLPLFAVVSGSMLLFAAAVAAQIQDGGFTTRQLLNEAFLVLCAVGILYAVFSLRRGTDFASVALLAPVCYLVGQIILLYRENARDPVVAHYYLMLLALAALCLSLLYLAAFSFRNGAPRSYIPMTQMAIVLGIASLADFFRNDLTTAVMISAFVLISTSFLWVADFEG